MRPLLGEAQEGLLCSDHFPNKFPSSTQKPTDSDYA